MLAEWCPGPTERADAGGMTMVACRANDGCHTVDVENDA